MKKVSLALGFFIGVVLVILFLSYRHYKALPTTTINIPPVEVPEQDTVQVDSRIATLEKFFGDKEMPLAEFAENFITAADQYGIDWRLLPAISIRESSGGLKMCGNNPFGWDSCDGQDFVSIEAAIKYVSERLASSPYYAGKTNYEKLRVYNSIIPTYPDEVINIMQQIRYESMPVL